MSQSPAVFVSPYKFNPATKDSSLLKCIRPVEKGQNKMVVECKAEVNGPLSAGIRECVLLATTATQRPVVMKHQARPGYKQQYVCILITDEHLTQARL